MAMLVGALDVLAMTGRKAPADLLLLAVPDEESEGAISTAAMRRFSERARIVLVLEPGMARAGGETLVSGRRGLAEWKLEVTGKAAHSGLAFWEGRSALAAAADWCVRAQRLSAPGPGVTVNVARDRRRLGRLRGSARRERRPPRDRAPAQRRLRSRRRRRRVPVSHRRRGRRRRRGPRDPRRPVAAEHGVSMTFTVGATHAAGGPARSRARPSRAAPSSWPPPGGSASRSRRTAAASRSRTSSPSPGGSRSSTASARSATGCTPATSGSTSARSSAAPSSSRTSSRRSDRTTMTDAAAPPERRIRMPHTLVIVGSLIVFVLVLSWVVPSGAYQTVEKAGRQVTIPGTYQRVAQGLPRPAVARDRADPRLSRRVAHHRVPAPDRRLVQRDPDDRHRRARHPEDHGRARLAAAPREADDPGPHDGLLARGGSVFGMAEEVIPFVLICVPLALSLGYDSIVGVSIPFLGAAAGFAAAFFNPFTVGLAQGLVGLPLYSGLGYRVITWFVCTGVIVGWVMVYAARVKRRPESSPVYALDRTRERSAFDAGAPPEPWTARRLLVVAPLPRRHGRARLGDPEGAVVHRGDRRAVPRDGPPDGRRRGPQARRDRDELRRGRARTWSTSRSSSRAAARSSSSPARRASSTRSSTSARA